MICLGSLSGSRPKFVKQYAKLAGPIRDALANFREEVEKGVFPGPEHGFAINEEEVAKLKRRE